MHVADKDLTSVLFEQLSGAPLTAAVYARMETPVSAAHWLGPLGNYLIARPAARAAAHSAGDSTGLPLDAAVVLAIGAGELHVWSADPWRSDVADHLGALALDEISGMTAETAKSWWPLTLSFANGESLELSARGDVSGLVSAYEAGRATSS